MVCLQSNHFPILSIIFIFPCVLIKPIQTSATIYPHYCLWTCSQPSATFYPHYCLLTCSQCEYSCNIFHVTLKQNYLLVLLWQNPITLWISLKNQSVVDILTTRTHYVDIQTGRSLFCLLNYLSLVEKYWVPIYKLDDLTQLIS